MKKFLTIVCFAVQTLIIGSANIFAIALVMNWFTDTIGYHGFWNIPVFLIVAAMVLATLVVYMKSIASQKRSDYEQQGKNQGYQEE